MRRKLGACLILAFVIGGCGRDERRGGDSQRLQITRLERLTLHRADCFGECPAYTVTVESDGQVGFEGGRFAAVTQARDRVSALELNALTDALNEKRFVDFNDRYEKREDGCQDVASDAQTVTLTVDFDGRSKTVRHYLGCRARQWIPPVNEQPKARPGTGTPVLPPNPWTPAPTLEPGAVSTPFECPYPLSLLHLEERIDSILRTGRWTGETRRAYFGRCASQSDRR